MSEAAVERVPERAPTVNEAFENLMQALISVLAAERGLTSLDAPFFIPDADEALKFAARDLTRAVDALPFAQQPKGWGR